MDTIDLFVSREERFSMGIDRDSGEYYISIPVANRLVDYEEYYRISTDEFNAFTESFEKAVKMAGQCRSQSMDHRLMVQPGSDRGIGS